MISEFKMGIEYKDYILNLLVKTDEKEAKILVVGKNVENGMQHSIDADHVVDSFDLPAETDEPAEAKAEFDKYIAGKGEAILDKKISELGEDFFMGFVPNLLGESVVEAEIVENDLRVVEDMSGRPVVIEVPTPEEFSVTVQEDIVDAEVVEEAPKPAPKSKAKPKAKPKDESAE